MNELQNSLFEAMKVFSDYTAANSDATITIQATITSVVDAGTGEYSVEYLGNTFSVYANSNVTYSVGDVVYVLVPDGDFSKNKVILSLVNPVAKTFINDADITKIYYEISDNLIDKDFDIIKMSSYGTTNIKNKDITNFGTTNFAKIITEYLTKYRTFSLSFMAQTSMVIDQQNSGNYGISIDIPLKANAAGGEGAKESLWKTVTLDVGNIIGNPYRLTEWAPQHVYFTIDEQYEYDTTKVPRLSYFCYGFNQDSSKTNIKDIWLKDIALNVVDVFSDEDTAGYRLTLKASEGEYFSTNYKTKKTLTPTLRVNGKTTSLKNTDIYWFLEDAEVKEENKYYSPYGGYGWRCLNQRTNIAMNPDGTETYDYITKNTTLVVTQNEVKASARYKCVVISKGIEASAIITLKNLETTKILELKPTLGSNVFVKDTGYVDLTATVYIRGVTESAKNQSMVKYSWMRYDKNGLFIKDTDDFFELISYNKVVRKEVAGSIVDCFETQVRYPVNKVEEVNNVFCSAKYCYLDGGRPVEELIGTESVMITTSTDFAYNLIINNANQLYKYDSDGDSPAGTAYDGPSTSKVTSIPALTYTIRKANGEELTNEEYCYVKYCWMVPKESMYVITKQSGTGTYKEDDAYYYFEGYDTYKHTASLSYGIAKRFNLVKSKAQIILKVEFQGNTIEREIPITFMKEGMNGSNGTAYAAELVSGGLSASTSVPYSVPNAAGVAQKLKFVYNISNKTLYRHDYDSNTLKPWSSEKRRIYPRVYFNGELTNDFTVEFSMFDARVTNACFKIANVDGAKGAQLELADGVFPDINHTYCNIVQAKITPQVNNGQNSVTQSNQILYCYYPIELTVTTFDTPIIPSVDGGFAEVMYASDGTNPSWDETAAFVCNDDDMISSDLSQFFDINWTAENHLRPATGNGKIYQPKPDNKYDDGNSKNLVVAKLSFRSDKLTWLNNEINSLNAKINSRNAEIAKLNNNLQYLRNFAAAYKRKNWQGKLKQIQVLLDKQTVAVYQLNTLLETSLVNLDRYISTKEFYENPKVVNICKVTIDQASTLKREAERAIVQIKRLNGTSGYDFRDLVSLANNVLDWTESLKSIYVKQLGLDEAISLQMMIEDINRQVSEYQKAYTALMRLSSKGYVDIYRKIQRDIDAMCNQIPNEAIDTYVELKNRCIYYADKFNTCTSIKDIQKCINDMYDYALKGIFYLSGTTLTVAQATINDFNQRIQRYNDLNAADRAMINNYNNIKSASGQTIVHNRPIVLYFNRYEMSNINAWDGNKIETGDGSYLLAPQVGAGIKENDNSFTGIMMGIKNFSTGAGAALNNQVGMFGYSKGKQSLRLDARTGTSIFGIAGTTEGGQVIIDPDNGGLLYSSNYWTNYNKNTGTPNNYLASNKSGNGTLINLKDGIIHLASANKGVMYSGNHNSLSSPKDGFYLSQNGLSIGTGFTISTKGVSELTHNGSNLGQWRIREVEVLDAKGNKATKQCIASKENAEGIYLDATNSTVVLGSSAGRIYSGQHFELRSIADGFYLSNDGLSIGKGFVVATDGVATATQNGGNLGGWRIKTDANGEGGFVSKDRTGILLDSKSSTIVLGSSTGKIYSGKHTTLGDTSNEGFYLSNQGLSIIGKDAEGNKNKFYISTSSDPVIYTGKHTSLTDEKPGYYIGANGLSIGSAIRMDATDGGSVLVGNLKSGNKYWTINGDTSKASITYGTRGNANSVSLRTDELTIGSKFYVSASDGSMRLGNGAVDGNGKYWSISTTKSTTEEYESYIAYNTTSFKETKGVYLGTDGIRLANKFSVDKDGAILSESGLIGGWVIGSKSISSDKIQLNAEGSIKHSGDSWSINQDGSATFKNLTASSKKGEKSAWSIKRNGSASFNNVKITGGSLKIGKTGKDDSGNFNNYSHIDSSGNATFQNITCENISAKSGYIGHTNNKVTTSGLSFKNGGIGLGSAGTKNTDGTYKGGITYSNGSVTISGDIYANNGYFKGEVHATSGDFTGSVTATSLTITGNARLGSVKDGVYTGVLLYGKDKNHYLKFGGPGMTDHPTVSGLNLSEKGDGMNCHGNGISECSNIGNKGDVIAAGTWKFGGSANIEMLSGDSYITLGKFVDNKIKSAKAGTTKSTGKQVKYRYREKDTDNWVEYWGEVPLSI